MGSRGAAKNVLFRARAGKALRYALTRAALSGLLFNGKLATQIASLVAIVVKGRFLLCFLTMQLTGYIVFQNSATVLLQLDYLSARTLC